ncbi:MAG: (2Fe-2S) ferredoxin domain-containing protein [Thermoguttaceae bacterium]|nr:(2Fe-2S) ferredoxin domain-containing protein [Thermoguttaceae bacterium]
MSEFPKKIVLCLGSSCYARGNGENLTWVENFLKEHGLTTTIELCGTRCEDQCAIGPTIQIDGTSYHEMSLEKCQRLFGQLLESNTTPHNDANTKSM